MKVNLALTVTLIVAAVVSYPLLLADYSGYLIIHPMRSSEYPSPDQFGLDYEDVTFTNIVDGTQFVGYFFPSKIPSDGRTMIVLHGYTGNQADMYAVGSNPYAGPFVQMFVENGYNVLTYDHRAHGRSGGDFTSIGVYEGVDLTYAVMYLKTRDDVDPEKIGALGHSMGAATSIIGSYFSGIRAVVADSGFENLHATALRVINLFSPSPEWLNPMSTASMNHYSMVPISSVSPIDYINRTNARVLIIQKVGDPIVPLEISKSMHAVAPNSEMWIPEGEGHVSAIVDDRFEYERHVISFLNGVFDETS